MQIGYVPNPREWSRWNEAEALLEPARKIGGFPSVLDSDESLFAVLDGDNLLGVASTWMTPEKHIEVKLVGGRDHHRWIGELDKVIGSAAREAGATRLIAWGRRGWVKVLARQGWEAIQMSDGDMAYSRRLGV